MRNKNAECRNIFSGILIAAMLLLGLSGCLRPVLLITGDCEGYFASSGMSLEQAVARAKPRAEAFDVLLMGSDGMVARISGDELDGCELVHSRENLWEIKSELHPRSVRVKLLDRIAIVGEGEQVGQLLLDDTLYLLKEEGTSQKNGRSVTVFTTRLRVPLSDGPVEMIADPPDLMITQTYHDAMDALQRGERVMILELDGLGWGMLERADAPFMKSLEPEPALAAWPPISPTGLASMLTGVTANLHGVHDRGIRELAREDLFAKAQAMGKTCAYIEGSQALLDTSLRPVLSLSDEAVFVNTRENLSADLLFAHFHGIDDTAHTYGPYAEETLQKIAALDVLVQALCEEFEGRVIIAADHGLHETQNGEGAHGEFRPEDMIVPYIIRLF